MEVIEHRPSAAAPALDRSAWRRRLRWLEDALQRPGVALLILLGSLLLTTLAWAATRQAALDDARQRFERHADDLHHRIARRLAACETVLRSGAALWAATTEVSRHDWQRYAETVPPGRHCPGLQGLGVARRLAPQALAAAGREPPARAPMTPPPGPAGETEQQAAIVHLEALGHGLPAAIGADLLADATQRAAMLRAHHTGRAALSGIVTLAQADGRAPQPGLVLFEPILRPAMGGAAPTPWGWVFAALQVDGLMQGIVGAEPDSDTTTTTAAAAAAAAATAATATMRLRIHDGAAGAPASAFYRWPPPAPGTAPGTAATQPGAATWAPGMAGVAPGELQRPLVLAGRRWTVVYEGMADAAAARLWPSNLVAAGGLAIDLLLFWSLAALARRKREFERQVTLRSAEAQARLSWLTAVSALSPDAVLVFERSGADSLHRLVFTNPAFSQWFGLGPEDLLGLSEAAVDEWLAGLAADGAEPMSALASGEASVTLAGPPRRQLQRGMREADWQRVYYFRDVTHESEVEQLKNEFLTTAAHELRTPLASVYGFAELLAGARVAEHQRQRAAEVVFRQAGVLKHLVDELLDLARIDSRRGRDFASERIDLNPVALAACESLLHPGQPARVQLLPAAAPVWTDGDAAKLQQVLVNVLGNGLKYSAAPAVVTLSILTARHEARDWALLRVVDQGIGMTEAQCARAFDRFYRADPSGHVLGAGLGLAIVHEIVALHHGRVLLHSTPGAGTQVTIWLPLAPAGASAASPATGPGTGPGSNAIAHPATSAAPASA
ncbi:CHASE domain-containing protein [Aquabacterium sp. OR-4]|uniref:CHASE domain-containing protein n=1 Tax=Aquabacterium sp. OR-4 TaxID=2978127 RepID=UPI0028CA05FF|nr:CHASE domain-containing protein [Aquabacterium sp. OR-4]MDT7835725.1 CHASE domain-containing protein [Aquabacterium sp. OR-4]